MSILAKLRALKGLPEPQLVFSPTLGERLRDVALERVAAGAGDDWLSYAEDAVLDIATAQDAFASDDVWALLQKRDVPRPPEPRALGAVIRDLAKRRVIEKTGDSRETTLASAHRRPITLWRLCRAAT